MACRTFASCLPLLVSIGTANIAAQQVEIGITRHASAGGGSFVTTTLGATAGGLAGLLAGVTLAPRGSGDCVLGMGGGCTDGSGGPQIAFVAGATVVGAAAGAWAGRRVSGGRQSVVGSLLGASVGLLVGAAVASQLEPEDPVPFALMLTIPTGLMAALGGW